MSAIPLFIQLFLVAVIYYGFFPVLYFFSSQKKDVAAYSLLGFMGGLGLLAVWNTPFAPFFLPVVLGAFIYPGAVILWGIKNSQPLGRLFFLSHIPIVAMAALFMLAPSWAGHLEVQLTDMLNQAEIMKSLETLESPEKVVEQFAALLANLFYGIWTVDLASRLIFGAYILTRVRVKNKPVLSTAIFKTGDYPEWPVWIVALGLAGLLVSMNFVDLGSLGWASGVGLLVVLPLYFLRGLKVLLLKMSDRPLSPYLKLLLLLLVLIFWHYIIVSVALIGLLDTWFDFNKPQLKRLGGE